MAATDALLADALGRDPAGPLVTFYDDASGDRTELSATTLATWVAKTANLLRDELDLEAGSPVAVRLPAHWQTAAVLLAAWSAGAVVDSRAEGARIVFCDGPGIEAARAAGPDDVVAFALAPLGRPFARPPEGAIDYAALVPGQGDHFVAVPPVEDTAPALTDIPGVQTGADVVADARRRAGEWGLTTGDRVLSTLAWSGYAEWRDALLAPLAAGASLVLCASPDPAALTRRAEVEQVTAVLGAGVDGVRSLVR